MEAKGKIHGRRWWRFALVVAGLALGQPLQGCALYGQLMHRGGSLPLGEGGAEWSPFVTTPTGGAVGVQIMRRF